MVEKGNCPSLLGFVDAAKPSAAKEQVQTARYAVLYNGPDRGLEYCNDDCLKEVLLRLLLHKQYDGKRPPRYRTRGDNACYSKHCRWLQYNEECKLPKFRSENPQQISAMWEAGSDVSGCRGSWFCTKGVAIAQVLHEEDEKLPFWCL